MDNLALTLVVVFAGVVLLPPLAARLRMPVIVLELLFGIAIGRSSFNIIPDSPIIDFFSAFGLTYLMFLAGMEIDMSKINRAIMKKVLAIALASIAVPFICGVALSYWVKMNPFLLGTILSTTSLGLVLPILKDLRLTRRQSQILLASVIVVDIASMFLLAFVLAALQGTLEVRFIYSVLAIFVLFLVPWFIKKQKLRRKFTTKLWKKQYGEMEMRAAFAIIFLLGAISFRLGFHSIIGAFIAGLLVSEILPRAVLQQEKLQSFGYSFFIPLFFIFIGAEVNLRPVFSSLNNLAILFAIIAIGILAKVLSVTIACRFSGFKMRQSLAFGLFHTARLSLIIAAVGISLELKLIDDNLFAIFIILAVVSASLAPSLGKYVLTRNDQNP
ncbi:MAG TPA: cation:proton antiporter [Dehalococcoidia bacterium]|nr:cation:proton antiporter [Dehalococcoidia bacterium]